MKRFVLSLLLFLLLVPSAGVSGNSHHPDDGFAIVIFKYNHTVNLWKRIPHSAEYQVDRTGGLYRSFPTGPKVHYGDERIPNGIYDADILKRDGKIFIEIRFETYPGWFEIYRLSDPSIDRNVIPMHADIYCCVIDAATSMRADGYKTIPVIILPGTLEPEISEKLERARNIKPWQSLDAVTDECLRWKPVEEYLIRSGRIPTLRFDGEEILIMPPAADPASLANKTEERR
ncbi:MAG: hypothetical protein C0600_05705 [Ignavibacteria bacterium]|nr:MAG: hypothetical protein C0600_05705 [Ignavibacteria bacterium]